MKKENILHIDKAGLVSLQKLLYTPILDALYSA